MAESGGAVPAWAVVGAGPHGLAALKALHQYGVPAVGFERAGDVGGMWNPGSPHSRVYGGMHTVTTKPFTQFPDFPMPASYPDYPSHRQILEYLQRYANHFGLSDSIQFGREVLSVVPEGERLVLTAKDVVSGEVGSASFAGVVVAPGHTSRPRVPRYPGQEYLDRPILHAGEYTSDDQLRGKRVLIVGAGTSGCEMAVEAARVAEHAYLSTRTGVRCVPKYVGGRPTDQVLDLLQLFRMPARVRHELLRAAARLLLAQPPGIRADAGAERVVNQLLAYYVRHGLLSVKPSIESFAEGTVYFSDNTWAEIDLVILATGYEPVVDFLPGGLLGMKDGQPHLGLNMFSPTHPGVVVLGLIEPDVGQWALAHWQAVLTAAYAQHRAEDPALGRDVAVGLRQQQAPGLRVEHQAYLRALETQLRRLECVR